jgi:hypothetical protein
MTIEEINALKAAFKLQVDALTKDNEKLTFEKTAAINDGKAKCDKNAELIKEISDLKAINKEYEDSERASYVKYFGDKNLPITEAEIMVMDIASLKEKKEWAEAISSEINDKQIKDEGFKKPKITDRKDINDKKVVVGSSIARMGDLNKKAEGDK